MKRDTPDTKEHQKGGGIGKNTIVLIKTAPSCHPLILRLALVAKCLPGGSFKVVTQYGKGELFVGREELIPICSAGEDTAGGTENLREVISVNHNAIMRAMRVLGDISLPSGVAIV